MMSGTTLNSLNDLEYYFINYDSLPIPKGQSFIIKNIPDHNRMDLLQYVKEIFNKTLAPLGKKVFFDDHMNGEGKFQIDTSEGLKITPLLSNLDISVKTNLTLTSFSDVFKKLMDGCFSTMTFKPGRLILVKIKSSEVTSDPNENPMKLIGRIVCPEIPKNCDFRLLFKDYICANIIRLNIDGVESNALEILGKDLAFQLIAKPPFLSIDEVCRMGSEAIEKLPKNSDLSRIDSIYRSSVGLPIPLDNPNYSSYFNQSSQTHFHSTDYKRDGMVVRWTSLM